MTFCKTGRSSPVLFDKYLHCRFSWQRTGHKVWIYEKDRGRQSASYLRMVERSMPAFWRVFPLWHDPILFFSSSKYPSRLSEPDIFMSQLWRLCYCGQNTTVCTCVFSLNNWKALVILCICLPIRLEKKLENNYILTLRPEKKGALTRNQQRVNPLSDLF